MLGINRECLTTEFMIQRELANGFLGSTTLLVNKNDHLPYICKTCKKAYIGPPEKVRSFIDYIDRVKNLSHEFPFIQPYTTIIEESEFIYLIRPYINAPTLSEYVNDRQLIDNGRVMSLWRIIVQCIEILTHNKITPIPIKPSNIFILNERYVSITDVYELSSDISWALQTPDSSQLLFMAPEYFDTSNHPSEKSDIWALGVLLLYMTGARLPWSTKNVFQMIKIITNEDPPLPGGLPANIAMIVSGILRKNPSLRPPFNELILMSNRHRRVLSGSSLQNNAGRSMISLLFQKQTPQSAIRQISASPSETCQSIYNIPRPPRLVPMSQSSHKISNSNSELLPMRSDLQQPIRKRESSCTIRCRFSLPAIPTTTSEVVAGSKTVT